MDKFNLEKFKSLLETEQFDAAQQKLEEFFRQNITAEETGKVLGELALMYVASENTLNQEYLQALKNATAMLKELHAEGKKLEDGIDLEFTRNQIHG